MFSNFFRDTVYSKMYLLANFIVLIHRGFRDILKIVFAYSYSIFQLPLSMGKVGEKEENLGKLNIPRKKIKNK